MSIHRRAARNDSNQLAVIEALEAIGCLVYVIRQPVDLLIGYRERWVLAEVKDGDKPPSARKMRESQSDFAAAADAHGLPWLLLTGPAQAVEAINVIVS